jgi:DNA-binding CsgD family transcriptional regulator
VFDEPMTTESNLARARSAFARRAWTEASEAFGAADSESPLGLPDLEQASLATHLTGSDDAAADLLSRAHHEAMRSGDVVHAARLAFWLGMMLSQRGEMAVAGGWLARATRLVEEGDLDCVERGYVLVPRGLRALDERDPEGALALFERAGGYAERFADPDLATMARLGRGLAFIDLSEVARGVALLDEAMLAVTADEVGPVIVGIVYCASIEAFHAIFDLRRAQEWTEALTRWCATQPDLAPFRGRCLLYRAELMRFHGAWAEAIDEARRAQEWLSRPPPEPAVGEAHYQQAELLWRRGQLAAAERAYREAGRWGRRTEPGLALLRLAQGQGEAGLAMLRRALEEARGPAARTALLDPIVEIALATGDVGLAASAAEELSQLAGESTAPLLTAMADRAAGCIRLAQGDPREALGPLRRAATAWQQLDAPYELARVRTSIGLALRELGDADTADIEFDAAREVFRQLGAEPDLARLEAIAGAEPARPAGLSVREVEVLRLLAGGLTNRTIAGELGISERTVDRHVSNVFTKLDVSSRSAATAAAYDRGLV